MSVALSSLKSVIPLTLLFAGILFSMASFAQGVQQMVIEQSEEFSYRGSAGMRALKGNVRLRHNQTVMYCDSALMFDGGRQAKAYGRVRIVEPGENLQVRCRYLEFDAEAGSARLYQDVVLTDDAFRLYAPELTYNTSRREVTYTQGAKMVDGSARLESRLGRYDVGSGDMIFIQDVILEDDSLTLTADSLRYNRKSGRMYFIAPTNFSGRGTEMETSGGWYELRSKFGHFFPNCSMRQENRYFLWSDSLYVDQNRGSGKASGRVQWIDTVQDFEIRARCLQFDRTRSSYKAWGNPLLRSFGAEADDSSPDFKPVQQDPLPRDTFNLTADTIIALKAPQVNAGPIPSAKKGTQADSSWLFFAWGKVAGQSTDAVMRCDSLIYHQSDSSALLIGSPLIWPASFQLFGPLMKVKFQGKNAGMLVLPEGGVLADRVNDSLFHQITAARIEINYDSGAIQSLQAIARSLVLYHVTGDDSGYIGLNRITSDSLYMYFTRQRPNRMVFLGKPEGILWPPTEVPSGEDSVPGFQWEGQLKIQASEQIQFSVLQNPNRGGYELFPSKNPLGGLERNGSKNAKRKSRRR